MLLSEDFCEAENLPCDNDDGADDYFNTTDDI